MYGVNESQFSRSLVAGECIPKLGSSGRIEILVLGPVIRAIKLCVNKWSKQSEVYEFNDLSFIAQETGDRY